MRFDDASLPSAPALPYDQLCADPLVTTVSQSLMGLTRQREMEKGIAMVENREHAFAGYAEGVYQQTLAKKHPPEARPIADPELGK